MGAIVGVVIGYALGTRAGPDGWADLKDAWKVISSSDEAKDIFATALSALRSLLGRGSEILAGARGSGEAGAGLSRVA
jgi:hypothetical protein